MRKKITKIFTFFFFYSLQRIQTEIGLGLDQMEIVFDTLDADRSGYLTFDEFIRGFGKRQAKSNFKQFKLIA